MKKLYENYIKWKLQLKYLYLKSILVVLQTEFTFNNNYYLLTKYLQLEIIMSVQCMILGDKIYIVEFECFILY